MRRCSRCRKGYWFHDHGVCRIKDHMDAMEAGATVILKRGGVEVARYEPGTPEHARLLKSMDPDVYLAFHPEDVGQLTGRLKSVGGQ